jgi:hypothetical protein
MVAGASNVVCVVDLPPLQISLLTGIAWAFAGRCWSADALAGGTGRPESTLPAPECSVQVVSSSGR